MEILDELHSLKKLFYDHFKEINNLIVFPKKSASYKVNTFYYLIILNNSYLLTLL